MSSHPSPQDAYQAVLDRCPPFSWAPPWDFLAPDPDCRGPLTPGPETLVAVRARFPDAVLRRAGVLVAGAGGPALNPALVDSGAVIALRAADGEGPFELLTDGGGLSGRVPLFAVMEDAWSRAHPGDGFLVVSPDLREVALLRALGVAAAPATGLDRLDLRQVRLLAAGFGRDPSSAGPAPGAGGEGGAPAGPEGPASRGGPAGEAGEAPWEALALLAGSLLNQSTELPPLTVRAARNWAQTQKHLGLGFPGVAVWEPGAGDWEGLRFRLTFRDRDLVREFLARLADGANDFDHLAARPPVCPEDAAPAAPAAGLIRARDDLLAALAAGPLSGRADQASARAQRDYDRAVQRELIDPTMAWALASPDPVVRNLAVQLGECCGLLHRMAPALHAAQARGLRQVSGLEAPTLPAGPISEYLQLTNRVALLVKSLYLWRSRR